MGTVPGFYDECFLFFFYCYYLCVVGIINIYNIQIIK